jgi:hypothetical protein
MIRRLLSNDTGASAAEFALVLPLLLLLLFGIIDGGRWLWTYNRAAKATQMGARFAVVAYPVAPGIGGTYIGVGGLTQGDLIPASAFGKIGCTGTVGAGGTVTASCTCLTTPCPTIGTVTASTFTNIVNRMRKFMPEITAANVAVEYSSSGLGYAGNPNGPDLQPLVTVKLGTPATPLQFRPIVALMLGTVNMPQFTSTLTAEDLTGSQSN